MKTLIKNARIVLPDEIFEGSLLIEDERIADIGPAIQIDAGETVDAGGKFLMPGVIDDQVHFREPGLIHKEDLAHASRACAKGGVTSFLEMPNTKPPATTQEGIEHKLGLAARSSIVNYGFYIGATTDNVAELAAATRTPGIKIFIGSSTGDLLVDDQEALERIFAETTLPICAHCEDEKTVRENAAKFADEKGVAVHSKIRDHRAAVISTTRAIDLSTRHKHPFHVLHVSTGDEVGLLRSAPEWVTAEACPHHLLFNIDDYDRLGSLVKMNPSIKTRADNEKIWGGLLDGTIEVIATDHAPHTLEEKDQVYPNCPSGLPAVENSLALMLNEMNNGRCTIEQITGWMCEAPARIWNMKNKGRIQRGADADLVMVDPELKHVVRNDQQKTKCGWSPWDGEMLKGWPVATWVMGHLVSRFNGEDWDINAPKSGQEIQFERPA
ncbi:MAG: dihydroorotase [Planctomycetota bacterium]